MGFADRFRTASTAQAEFADRVDEQAAFDTSVAVYAASIDELRAGVWTAIDSHRPRRNVLTYYGIGGIGKSTLLGKLDQRVRGDLDRPSHWPIAPEFSGPVVTCRLDASDFDVEDALLLVRAAAAGLAKPFQAFDMCLARYWSERHSQGKITEIFRQRDRLRGVADSVRVAELVQTAVEDVASNVLGSALPGFAAFRAMAHMSAALWRKRLDSTALRTCAGLDELLAERTSPETLPYYAYALAWDLEQIQRKNGARFVVFVDAFEDASRTTADFINKLAWMLPNVLFVIAGRNALAWATKTAELEFSGAVRWPGLVLGSEAEPRQHLVGYLSMDDRARWLEDALRGRCDRSVIEVAAQESHGLPVHLDLIAQHVLEIAQERVVAPEDVTGDLDAVAKRVLRDLTDPQRRALLVSCLYRRFDEELVRATADLANSGPVAELLERPYVERLRRSTYEYRLHDLLRGVFGAATGLGDDQWLLDDWGRAAARGMEALRTRLAGAKNPLEFREHAELLFGLVATFGCDADWVVDVAQQLVSRSNWSTEWSPRALGSLTRVESWSSALADGIAIIMTRQGRNRTDIAAELRAIVAPYPDEPRLDVLRYFLGQAQRDGGDVVGSLETMSGLLTGVMVGEATKGVAHVLRRAGRFGEAEQFIRDNAATMRRATRVLGELRWTEGRLGESLKLFAEGASEAHRDGDGGEHALCVASSG